MMKCVVLSYLWCTFSRYDHQPHPLFASGAVHYHSILHKLQQHDRNFTDHREISVLCEESATI